MNNTITNNLIHYDLLQGSKYKLNKCFWLLGAAGICSYVSICAITDKPIKNYLAPSATVATTASLLFLLVKNKHRMKPQIASRGIKFVEQIINHKIGENHSTRNELFKAATNCLEHASRQQANLSETAKANISFDQLNKEFKLDDFNKAAIKIVDYINSNIILTKKIRADIIEGKKHQKYQDLESCNLKLNDYQEALLHTKVFIAMEDNSKTAHDVLLNNLQGILSYEELQHIDNLLLKMLLIRFPETTKLNQTPTETAKFNLVKWAKTYMEESRKIRNEMQQLKDKFNLKINNYGVAEFLNPNALIENLPK